MKKQEIKELHPLVHCITNIVTANDCANALLAVGASPTMAHHPKEVAEMATSCNALVLNMGATEWIEAMHIAGKAAKDAGRPIVLDPVGAAGTKFRREETLRLVEAVKPDCIRGNVSELRALALGSGGGLGVDVKPGETVDLRLLQGLAEQYQCMVIASGATDYVASANGEIRSVTGGSAMMKAVTGAGCMSGALLGACLAVECSADSACWCLETISRCAEQAEWKTRQQNGGSMTFRMHFIDELYLL